MQKLPRASLAFNRKTCIETPRAGLKSQGGAQKDPQRFRHAKVREDQAGPTGVRQAKAGKDPAAHQQLLHRSSTMQGQLRAHYADHLGPSEEPTHYQFVGFRCVALHAQKLATSQNPNVLLA